MRTRDAAALRHAHLSILGILVALRGFGLVYSGKLFWSTHPWSSLLFCPGAWCVDVVPSQALPGSFNPCSPAHLRANPQPLAPGSPRSFVAFLTLLFCLEEACSCKVPGCQGPPLHSLCTFTSLWPHNRFVVFPWVPTPFRLVSQQKPTAVFLTSCS